MPKEVSRGQALNVAGRVAIQVKWDEIDGDLLQREIIELTPEEFGDRFTSFLKNGGRFIFGDPKSILTKMFDPAEFIGNDWTIWKGPAEGDGLTGEEDFDPRSVSMTVIEISKLIFETCLKEGETSITGKEKSIRLKQSGQICLGGNVFLGLWLDYQANKENSVLEWLWRNHKISHLDFFGTILRSPHGYRHVPGLCRDGDVRWHWYCRWIDDDRLVGVPSAVLAST